MLIRKETHDDRDTIRAVNESAFDTSAEADLVDELHVQESPVVSLVAEDDGEIIGHIFFSPVTLENHPDVALMGLAPMAVTPERQRSGVGTALIRAGLSECRALGTAAVVVLGHPDYYPRFGFLPASQYGIKSEYDAPEIGFLLLVFEPQALRHKAGTVKYAPAFDDL